MRRRALVVKGGGAVLAGSFNVMQRVRGIVGFKSHNILLEQMT
jgi:hypothetical protein